MILIKGLEPTTSVFPDKEHNITFQKSIVDYITNDWYDTVRMSWRFDSNEEIMDLGIIIDLIATYTKKDITITIPFLPYSRMDRHEEGKHNAFSLQVLGGILESFQLSVPNVVNIITLDVHNSEALPECITNRNDIIDLIANNIPAYKLKNMLLVLPDKGSKRRYKDDVVKYFGAEHVIGEKQRDFDTHKITKYTLPDTVDYSSYKEALIVDDIISYGGTFIKLIDTLHEKGITDITLVTSHAEDALWRGDLTTIKGLKIITSNSLTTHPSTGNVTVDQSYFN